MEFYAFCKLKNSPDFFAVISCCNHVKIQVKYYIIEQKNIHFLDEKGACHGLFHPFSGSQRRKRILRQC